MNAFLAPAAPSFFATGLVALDVLFEPDDSGAVRYRAGGTAGNVAAILGALGWTSALAGPDEHSVAYALMRSDLGQCRVDYHPVTQGTAVPVIVQEFGFSSTHRFRFDCPTCGRALPRFRRTAYRSDDVLHSLSRHANVFFADRLSDDVLELATLAHRGGAFVVYEPSDPDDAPWFEPMFELAHMVKWSSERAEALPRLTDRGDCLEVQSLGARGPRVGQPEWQTLDAAHVPRVVDTCGAGDWLTSGILMGLADMAFQFECHAAEQLVCVLQNAQRLAAWSCGFAGARGALYRAGPAAAMAAWQPTGSAAVHDPLPEPAQPSSGCIACPP